MLRSWCQTGLEAKILASASALTTWPQPRAFGLGLVKLASKMCYPMQNNIGCIHFVVVSLQHSLQWRGNISTLMWDTNSLCVLGIVAVWYTYVEISTCGWPWPWPRPRGSGLNLSLGLRVLASTLALTFWPRLTSLLQPQFCYISKWPKCMT